MVFVVSSLTCKDSLSLYQYDTTYMYIHVYLHTIHHSFLSMSTCVYIYILYHMSWFSTFISIFFGSPAWLLAARIPRGWHLAFCELCGSGAIPFWKVIQVPLSKPGRPKRWCPLGKVEVGKKSLEKLQKRRIQRDVFFPLKRVYRKDGV